MHEQGRSPVPGRARFGHAALMSLPKKWRTNVKHIFLAAAFTLATIASANADTTCVVNSPDGELNVRDLTQNGLGRVIGTVKNGHDVTMRDFYFLRGQSWARVVDGKTKTKVVGWMFKDYLNCNNQPVATTPTPKSNYVELKNAGIWTTYTDISSNGVKIIGMYTTNGTNTIYIKFNSSQMFVHLFKKGWNFPTNAEVPFTVKFDNNPDFIAPGRGRMDNAGSAFVETSFQDVYQANNFISEFMHADKMTITFKQGNERPWVVDTMKGSREAATAFMDAVKATCPDCMKPTQPYDTPSQPTAKNNNDI